MLAVFVILFGSIGVFLNWPVFRDGIFRLLTSPWSENSLFFAIQQYSHGFSRPDGIVVIGLSLVILLTAFIRTRRFVLNLRILLLVIIMAIMASELFTVFQLKFPLYSYTGLLYSGLFYFFALVSAIFRFGSMKSFNSTFMGKPMSESRVFSQTFSQVLGRVSGSLQINIEAVDQISPDFNQGKENLFGSAEIKIGRDKDWADLVVGDQWDMVSNRHGIIRAIGNSLVYEPLSGHYAFALNGNPYTVPREIPSSTRLNLVSGAGPVLTVSYRFQKQPLLHPKTMLRAGEIARDEFKRLQSTFKVLVIMVILGLPLLWIFSGIQKKALGNYIDGIKIQNEQFTRDLEEKVGTIEEMNRESGKTRDEIRRLKNRIKGLEQTERVNQDEVDNSRDRLDGLKNRNYSGKISLERQRVAKIIDIKLSSQRISIYFPAVTFFAEQKVVFGAGFFLKDRSGKYVLATEKSKILDRVNPKSIRTFFFIYPDSWKAFEKYYSDVENRKISITAFRRDLEKNSARYNLMAIDGRQWKQGGGECDGNAVVTSWVKNFPGYLLPYVPGMDSGFSSPDQAIVYGFSSGRKMVVPVSVVSRTRQLITVKSASVAGFSGGLLIRVSTGGKYTAIGISHSSGKAPPSRQLKFLAF
jgi:hypothetical protein